MMARTQIWRLLATVPFLVWFSPGPAACQEDRGTLVRGAATQFDYSKSQCFPVVFSPYIAPVVPEPRLDTSRRLQDLIVDGKLDLTTASRLLVTSPPSFQDIAHALSAAGLAMAV